MGEQKKLTVGQELSRQLSHELLEVCARFSDRNGMKEMACVDEMRVCLAALQAATIGILSGRDDSDILLTKLAETLVNGTAKGYIDEIKLNNKGLH